jgi:FkbM family methyltransferase
MHQLVNIVRGISVHPLTCNSRLSALARIANWQVRSRLQEEVIVPWIGGLELALRRGMTGATGNVYVGLHEFTDMVFLLHFLRAGDLFLDIGANVGTYTLLASGICRARSLAFEPDPGTAAALRRNVELNRLGDRTCIHQVAVGPEDGEVNFSIGRDTKNAVIAASDNCQTVRQIRLDTIGDNPTFAKIDVEGYEDRVLAGAKQTLAKPSLQVIALETVKPQIRKTLNGHGFERVFYEPFTRKLTGEPIGFPASNAVFVRSPEFVMNRVRGAPKIKIIGSEI